ncbi:MAG: hypothetical protein ABI969_10105 [bacterium]
MIRRHMLKWGFSKLASAFQDLAEAQKTIDESARKVVESLTRMIDVTLDEVPSSRDTIPDRDFTWYDEIAATLAREGFGSPAVMASAASLSAPSETRALSEYAIGDGGAVVASWFQLPPKDGVPGRKVLSFTTATQDDKTIATVRNFTPTGLELSPTSDVEYADENISVDTLLAGHRARVTKHGAPPRLFADVAAYQEWQQYDHQRTAQFRRAQGILLIERFFEKRFTGDKAEIGARYIQSLRAHPEWYKYSAGVGTDAPPSTPPLEVPPVRTAPPKLPLNFFMSASEDGRRTVTTFGMIFAGLVPELLARGVAANHSRAARFLLATVARAIARRRSELPSDADFLAALVSQEGMRIELLPGDAATIAGVTPEARSVGGDEPVFVHVSLKGFDDSDEPSLLNVNPLPGAPGAFDERLHALCARLGVEVPVAANADSMEAAMQDASLGARARLPDVRSRFQRGLGADEKICVKVRVVEGDTAEFVWLEVRQWRQGEIDGDVLTPAPRIKLAKGVRLTIAEERLHDWIETGPNGMKAPSATDLVATDYGMDI